MQESQRRISSGKSMDATQNMTNMDEREDFERNNSYNATYKCSMIN